MKTIEQLEQKNRELEAELERLEKPEPTFSRKMRFEGPNGDEQPVPRWVDVKAKRQYSFEELAIGRMILQARNAVLPDGMEAQFQTLSERFRKYTMTTEDAGAGAELVDTVLWGELFEDIHAATLVANLFTPHLPMTAGKMELSELGDAVFYRPGGEGQAVTATDLITAKRALTAYTIKSQVDISDEESEDAVVNALAAIRRTLIRNAAEAIDEVILNADASTGTQNINWYAASGGTDIAVDSRFLLGFDGLIHYCKNELTGTPQDADLGTLETADFATLIGLLGKYADVPSRCAFIIDRGVKNKAIALSDFQSMDKIGPRATLLTGQIAEVYGIPVILSAQMLKSNATGQVDQTTASNDKGRIVLVNRDMWVVGFRRRPQVRTERNEAKGLTSIVATLRIALQCFGDRTDPKYCHTALGYNVTV